MLLVIDKLSNSTDNAGLFSDLMKFSVENESLSITTSMFCLRENLIGLKTKNFPHPRRNGFSTDQPVLPIVIQKREVTCDPSGFVLNGSVQIK